jgi:peptidoglycan hydrolase-like protein with peptidoglycan-binding domain
MASAFVACEAQQLIGMARYLVSMSIASILAKTQWTRFARLYNGPNYVANRYDIRLQKAFERFSTTGLPDLNVRAAQLMMTYHGHPLSVDGVLGPETRLALLAYQKAEKLAATGFADPDTLNRLEGI